MEHHFIFDAPLFRFHVFSVLCHNSLIVETVFHKLKKKQSSGMFVGMRTAIVGGYQYFCFLVIVSSL